MSAPGIGPSGPDRRLDLVVATLWWARSWPGWHRGDWRYVMFRERFGVYFNS